jgi:transposase InsO family protein
MPAHWRWAVIRRRQEWFRVARGKGVAAACRAFGISRKTYYKWWTRYQAAHGDPASLQDQSRRPKTHPQTAPPKVVQAVIRLRKRYGYGPRRLQFYLREDEKITFSVCGIYKILNRAGLIVRYARKRKKYQTYAPYIRFPGQKVQVDVKYVPWSKGQKRTQRLYQYSAKDLFTKLRFIRCYDELSAKATVDFLKRALRFFPFPVRCLQTDNGVEFTYVLAGTDLEHPMDTLCREHKIRHALIPVACPRYNGQVERSHRTDMEELYRRSSYTSLQELAPQIERYAAYYNHHRPHMALNMLTPLQKLRSVKGYENARLNYRCHL